MPDRGGESGETQGLTADHIQPFVLSLSKHVVWDTHFDRPGANGVFFPCGRLYKTPIARRLVTRPPAITR